MCQATKNAHKTAIKRSKLSAPSEYLVKHDLVNNNDTLDYGCGKGYDCDSMGWDGYDPHYRSEFPNKKYDTIVCNFVLNVLPESKWNNVIDSITSLLKPGGFAWISVRNDKSNLNGFTKIGTYQTFVELDLPVEKRSSTFVMYHLKNVKND